MPIHHYRSLTVLEASNLSSPGIARFMYEWMERLGIITLYFGNEIVCDAGNRYRGSPQKNNTIQTKAPAENQTHLRLIVQPGNNDSCREVKIAPPPGLTTIDFYQFIKEREEWERTKPDETPLPHRKIMELVRLSRVQRSIFENLGHWCGVNDILQDTSFGTDKAATLQRLVDLGILQRINRGTFRLVRLRYEDALERVRELAPLDDE